MVHSTAFRKSFECIVAITCSQFETLILSVAMFRPTTTTPKQLIVHNQAFGLIILFLGHT